HAVYVVGPHDELGAWARAGRDPVHLARDVQGRETQRELVQAHFGVDGPTLLRGSEHLGEPERVAVEARRGLDILDVEVDPGAGEHASTLRRGRAPARRMTDSARLVG